MGGTFYVTHKWDQYKMRPKRAVNVQTVSTAQPQPSTTPTTNTIDTDTLLMPYAWYQQDLQSIEGFVADIDYKSEDGSKELTIQFAMRFDYATGAKFVTVYVPHTDTWLAYEICRNLPKHLNEYAARTVGDIVESVTAPGDSTAISSRDLRFTGRVIIYHSDTLSLEQLGTLEGIYRQAKLSLICKGPAYAYRKWQDYQVNKLKPPSSIPNKATSQR